jgi:hypothetical protein
MSSRFHHTIVGIVHRHSERKLLLLQARCLWPWQRRNARNLTQWRSQKKLLQLVMLEEPS